MRRAGKSRSEPPEVALIRHLIKAVTNKDREEGVIPEFRGFGGKWWCWEVRGWWSQDDFEAYNWGDYEQEMSQMTGTDVGRKSHCLQACQCDCGWVTRAQTGSVCLLTHGKRGLPHCSCSHRSARVLLQLRERRGIYTTTSIGLLKWPYKVSLSASFDLIQENTEYSLRVVEDFIPLQRTNFIIQIFYVFIYFILIKLSTVTVFPWK